MVIISVGLLVINRTGVFGYSLAQNPMQENMGLLL